MLSGSRDLPEFHALLLERGADWVRDALRAALGGRSAAAMSIDVSWSDLSDEQSDSTKTM
jgi:hypothetical protein